MFGGWVWGRDVGQGVLSVKQSSLTPHAYPPPKSCEHIVNVVIYILTSFTPTSFSKHYKKTCRLTVVIYGLLNDLTPELMCDKTL